MRFSFTISRRRGPAPKKWRVAMQIEKSAVPNQSLKSYYYGEKKPSKVGSYTIHHSKKPTSTFSQTILKKAFE